MYKKIIAGLFAGLLLATASTAEAGGGKPGYYGGGGPGYYHNYRPYHYHGYNGYRGWLVPGIVGGAILGGTAYYLYTNPPTGPYVVTRETISPNCFNRVWSNGAVDTVCY